MSVELLAVLVVLVAAYTAYAANRFAQQRHLVEESWRQVEVELQRRRDLVPALVEQVRAYEAHEAGFLEGVLDGLTDAQASAALLALPAPQTGPVQQLMVQLAETEDRIAAARRFHLANRRALQSRLEGFPSGLVARGLALDPPDVPELEDSSTDDGGPPPS